MTLLAPSILKPLQEDEQDTINRAISILHQRVLKAPYVRSPGDAKKLARLELALEKREVFCVFFLNVHHQVIAFEKLFYGSLNECTVISSVILRRAIEVNAGAAIIVHNHPSGDNDPSKADLKITENISHDLKLIDVKLLDHFIVSLSGVFSFAEKGLFEFNNQVK